MGIRVGPDRVDRSGCGRLENRRSMRREEETLKRPTIKTVAAGVGLSANTVSRALAGKEGVAKHTRDLVIREAKRVGYVGRVQFLRSENKTIAVMVSNSWNVFIMTFISAIESALRPLGYSAVIRITKELPEVEAQAIAEMLEAQHAGVIVIPVQVAGEQWLDSASSKGLTTGYASMCERVRTFATGIPAGAIVVTDASSCTDGYLKVLEGIPTLTIKDSVTFIAGYLHRLTVTRPLQRVVIHPTCSSERLNTTADLVAVAQHVAEEVVMASEWACCGFASDRGMLFPELTASATKEMVAEIRGFDADAFVSCNRRREMGMTRATQRDYGNILETMEWDTRAES